MAPFPKLIDLSSFLKDDRTKSFWNGAGKFSVLSEQLVAALENDPGLTVGALRAKLREAGKPLLLQTGLDFDVDVANPVRLGAKHGSAGTGSVAFSPHVDVDARAMLILAPDALAALESDHPSDLGKLLHDHTVLSGQNALVVLAAGGDAGADFATTVLNRPGLKASISFQAGAGVAWVVCRPADDGERILDVVRHAFANARLPQSDPDDLLQTRGTVTLSANEMLLTSWTGFLTVGGEATFGYSTSGTTNYVVGHLDLATKLVLKAQAKVSASFGLAGAFRTIVLPGAKPGWVRVVVEKDRTSTFEFGVDVKVDAKLKTSGLPDAEAAPLVLLESIFGFTTPQLAHQILDLALLPPADLRKRTDGALKAVIEKYTGKALEALFSAEGMSEVLNRLVGVARTIAESDDRLIGLYEQYVVGELESALKVVEGIVAKASLSDQREALLERIGDEKVRHLVGLLADRAFGQVIVAYEESASEIGRRVQQLRAFINGDAEKAIRRFIETRRDALGLTPLFNAVAKIDTVAKLKSTTSSAVIGLIERLTGKALDQILAAPDVKALLADVNKTANRFTGILKQLNETITKALNAQGRFEVSYAYQRVRHGDALVDIQIAVEQKTAALRKKAHEIYRQATRGHFDEVLTDDNAPFISVSAAAFTDSLKRVGTLKVNVFGWTYKEVNTLLTSLEGNVKDSPTGLITVYNVSAKGTTLRASRRRTVELGYALQVTGEVKGAFATGEALRPQTVDAFKTLQEQLQTELEYRIKDPLTSLDELRSYLSVGTQLRLLDDARTTNLTASLQELRTPANGAPAALTGAGLRSVGVTYTVGFTGEALANALTTDLTGTLIPWWDDDSDGRGRKRVIIPAPDHQTAVIALYIDRLIGTYILGRRHNRNDYAVAAIFLDGFLLDMPNGRWPLDRRVLNVNRMDGEVIPVAIPAQAVEWARHHYFVARSLAAFLDRFRITLRSASPQPISTLESFLNGVVEHLMETSDGNEDEQACLPFLLLDELVRRTQPAAPDARRALLEITLFDDKGKAANYIPVVA